MAKFPRDQPNKAASSPAPAGRRRGIAASMALAAGALVLTTPAQGQPADAEPEAGEGAAALNMIADRRVLSYPLKQVWPTTIRYLRIDRSFKVTDRDEEAGYVMFEFALSDHRRGTGSVEMFETVDASGRPSVSIGVNTGAGPLHLSHAILDGIATKVRSERGQPAAPPVVEEPPDKDEPGDDHSVPLLPPAQDP